jgi:hypothetical protein
MFPLASLYFSGLYDFESPWVEIVRCELVMNPGWSLQKNNYSVLYLYGLICNKWAKEIRTLAS